MSKQLYIYLTDFSWELEYARSWDLDFFDDLKEENNIGISFFKNF